MNRKSVIIIDDEQDARVLLRQYVSACEHIDIVAECSDGEQAISAIDSLKPDWAFLDIEMPGANGFSVLKSITHIPQIVFSTAYNNFALEAFDSNAIDYLLKPYSWSRFSKAVEKLRTDTQVNYKALQLLDDLLSGQYQSDRYFFVYNGKKLATVKVEDIVLLEASDDYTKVYTREKNYLSHTRISVMDQRLDPRTFIRIHRSHIINIAQVIEAYRNANGIHIQLSNGTVVKVSRPYQEHIRRYFL